jgi:hypothetical protein
MPCELHPSSFATNYFNYPVKKSNAWFWRPCLVNFQARRTSRNITKPRNVCSSSIFIADIHFVSFGNDLSPNHFFFSFLLSSSFSFPFFFIAVSDCFLITYMQPVVALTFGFDRVRCRICLNLSMSLLLSSISVSMRLDFSHWLSTIPVSLIRLSQREDDKTQVFEVFACEADNLPVCRC